MGKIYFQSDNYFNNETKLNSMFGDSAIPVDMNAGYVPEKGDKWGMCQDCGKCTQDNIQTRFGLCTPNEGGESY